MSDKRVHQRPRRSRRRVDDHPLEFVEDDQIIVLEDDANGYPRQWLGVDRLGYFQQEPVTGLTLYDGSIIVPRLRFIEVVLLDQPFQE